MSNSQNLVVLISLLIISPVIFILNLLVVISLVKTKQLRNLSNFLLLLLSLSDCFVGTVTIPLEITLFSVFRMQRVCTLEYVVHFFVYFTTHFSAYLIAVIAVHRNVYVNPNLERQGYLSRLIQKRHGLTICIIVTLLVTVTEGLVSMLFYSEVIPMLVLVLVDGILFVSVYATYFWVYFKVWRFSKDNVAAQSRHQSSQDRLAKTVAIILISMAVCYLPYIVVAATKGKSLEKQNLSSGIQFPLYITLVLVLSNSAVNAVIIMVRCAAVRKYVVSAIFRCNTDPTDVPPCSFNSETKTSEKTSSTIQL